MLPEERDLFRSFMTQPDFNLMYAATASCYQPAIKNYASPASGSNRRFSFKAMNTKIQQKVSHSMLPALQAEQRHNVTQHALDRSACLWLLV